jgi:hypothetical protein
LYKTVAKYLKRLAGSTPSFSLQQWAKRPGARADAGRLTQGERWLRLQLSDWIKPLNTVKEAVRPLQGVKMGITVEGG